MYLNFIGSFILTIFLFLRSKCYYCLNFNFNQIIIYMQLKNRQFASVIVIYNYLFLLFHFNNINYIINIINFTNLIIKFNPDTFIITF